MNHQRLRVVPGYVANLVVPTLGPTARRLGPPLVRLAAATTVLALLARQLGAAPFRHGLDSVTLPAIGLAVAVTAVATTSAALRWCVVARALGIPLRPATAIGAYYRSQFLNSVLPGGIVGDVHRAVVHGRRTSELGTAARAVVWERAFNQTVQLVVTAVVLLTLPSPIPRRIIAGILVAVAIAALVAYVAARRTNTRRTNTRRGRVLATILGDLRRLGPSCRLPVLASLVCIVGHTTMFVVAARMAGCTAPTGEVVALAMLIQNATTIPLSVGGWGLREGAAAWAFAAAGLGATTGVAITTVYAVMALVAVTPGVGLLAADGVRALRRGETARESARVSARDVRRGSDDAEPDLPAIVTATYEAG